MIVHPDFSECSLGALRPFALSHPAASEQPNHKATTDSGQPRNKIQPFLTLKAAQESIQNFLAEFSPYLSSQWQNDEPFVVELLQNGVLATIATLLGNHPSVTRIDQAELMRQLRRTKNRLALAVAVGDILDILSLEEVTHSLSDFAEAAITRAAEFLCRHHLAVAAEQRQAFLNQTASLADSGQTTPLPGADDWTTEAATSGLIILGMGKLGARELNYSSDIDLIILFDPSLSP
ncbi:MAG: hypothetical protein ORO03_08815, partial [Alphaproteobacteria bacterium]|nr:hypothetical protein [Alphaproteobacteria bacterium]